MTDAERCKVFVENIKAYWDYTLTPSYDWILLVKDDNLRASIGEAVLKGIDDAIIVRLSKLYNLIEGRDDLTRLFAENLYFAVQVSGQLEQRGFSFTVGSILTDDRRIKDWYYVYAMAIHLDSVLTKKYVSIAYFPPTVLFYVSDDAIKVEQTNETTMIKPGTTIKVITDDDGYTEFNYATFNSYSRPFFNVRVGNKNKQFRQEGIREIIVPLDPSSMNFF